MATRGRQIAFVNKMTTVIGDEMKLSYEIKFRLWIVLFLGVSAASFLVSTLVGMSVTLFLLVVGALISTRRTWWLPRVSKKLPVFLMLHSVSDSVVEANCPNNSLRPRELDRLIHDLLCAGYTFQTAIDASQKPKERSVVLTFDDGLIDNYINLFPILKKYNVPATLFVTNRGVEKPNEFLTAEHIREMAASGLVEFGGHTVAHTILDTVPLDVAKQEIQKNYDWLTEILKTPPQCFAYPCGGYNSEIIDAVKAIGYSYAFTMHKRMRAVEVAPYQIHRQIIPRGKKPVEAYLIATRGKCNI